MAAAFMSAHAESRFQAFTRIWFRVTLVVTWSLLGNTPSFCQCSIPAASDGFSFVTGGQRSPRVQQTLPLQLLALVHALAFPFMLYTELCRSVCVHSSHRSSAPRFYCRSLILSHIDQLFLLA